MQIINKKCTQYHVVTDTKIANNFFLDLTSKVILLSLFPWRMMHKQNGERKGLEKYDVLAWFENKIATVNSSGT